jgi:hypothetical protein
MSVSINIAQQLDNNNSITSICILQNFQVLLNVALTAVFALQFELQLRSSITMAVRGFLSG